MSPPVSNDAACESHEALATAQSTKASWPKGTGQSLPEDFTPGYTPYGTAGLIGRDKSVIALYGNTVYVATGVRVSAWNTMSGECTATYEAGKHSITAIAISKDILAVGCENGRIIIYRPGRPPHRLRLHSRRVQHLLIDDNSLFSCAADGSLLRYDTLLEAPQQRYNGCSVAFVALAISYGHVIATCADNTIRIWRQEEDELIGAYCYVRPLAGAVLAADGSVLAIFADGRTEWQGGEEHAGPSFKRLKETRWCNGQIILRSGKELTVAVPGPSGGLHVLRRIPAPADCLAAVVHESAVVCLTKHNALQFFAAGKDEAALIEGGHRSAITHAVVAADRVFTVARHALIAWDVDREAGALIRALTLPARDVPGRALKAVAVFNGELVVAGAESLHLYDLAFLSLQRSVPLPDGCRGALLLCASVRVLVVASGAELIFLGRDFIETGRAVLPDAATALGFSADGAILAAATLSSKIEVYEMPAAQHRLSLYGHALPVRQLAVSADGRHLASAGADRLVKLWGLEFGECRKTLRHDAASVAFVHGTRFVLADGRLVYYNGQDLLKRFHCAADGPLVVGTDFIVAAAGAGVELLAMDTYELLEEAESDEESPLLPQVENPDAYERFLGLTDKLAAEYTETTAQALGALLEDTDLVELESYLALLDAPAIHALLALLAHRVPQNIIVRARIFLILCREHRREAHTSGAFAKIQECLFGELCGLRDTIGTNSARFTLALNSFSLD